MASVDKMILLESAVTAGSADSAVSTLEGHMKDLIATIVCSVFTSGTIAAKIQHSHNGTNWFDLVSFAALTGTGSELKNITVPALGQLRVNTSGGVGTLKIELAYGR